MFSDNEQYLEQLRQLQLKIVINPLDTADNNLPLITDPTYTALVQEYQIYGSSSDIAAINRFRSTPLIQPYARGLQIAESYMRFFKADENSRKNGMFFQTCQWIDSLYPSNSSSQFPPQLKDASLVGFTTVINAFQIEFGDKRFFLRTKKE